MVLLSKAGDLFKKMVVGEKTKPINTPQ